MHRISLLLLVWSVAQTGWGNEPIDFDRQIRPLLANKCFRCHGPDEAAREADLRLDVREAALDAGAIVPESADDSELVARILSEDDDLRMPPVDSNLEMSDDERALLVRWIDEGAEYTAHWSFQPIQRPPLPDVSDTHWPANPIDRFVLARLDQERLAPSPPAEAYRLVRRLYLDLLGIPPTPAQADSFAENPSPVAYQALVDRLLQSPQFGERQAWPWLDAARYADSNGYQGDRDRTMWPWRDWVVQASNRNLPYDQFTVMQLAGDLLPDPTFEQQLATGFSRNHMINGEGGRIPEENRVDYVMDMSETMATVWLGLTLNCCRCHDHKYDPLTRREYYQLFDFFNQTPVDGGGGDPQTQPVLAYATDEQERQLAAFETELQQLATQIDAWNEASTEPATDVEEPDEASRAADEALQPILQKPATSRSDEELQQLIDHWKDTRSERVALLEQFRTIRSRRDGLRNGLPKVMVMADRDERRVSEMLAVGLYNRPEGAVTAEVPSFLPSLGKEAPANRLALAMWLVGDEQPLTARVAVNRLWQQLFGTGLVKTTEDFGTQGERPTHPELLDWLAAEYRDSGWNTKALLRLIVTSRTYQQSSRVTSELWERDPYNRLLARGARFRLPSWLIRDQALAVSGLLVQQIGGPPVQPYQPAGVWSDATFGKKLYQRDHGAALYRRSLYTFWRRIIAPTMFFDTATRQTCAVTDSRTNTPLHALVTLNDVTFVEAARVLAQRLLTNAGDASDEELVTAAFRTILVRPPSSEELEILLRGFSRLQAEFAAAPESAAQLISVGEAPVTDSIAPPRLAALAALCAGMLNLDETLTKE